MPDLLIEACRTAGRLDELAGEVRKLAANKVENADVLYALIQLALGKGETVEDMLNLVKPREAWCVLEDSTHPPVLDPATGSAR